MIKVLLIAGAVSVLVSPAEIRAQTSKAKEEIPLPPAPIVARAPALAAWRITYTYDAPAPTQDPQAKRAKDQPMVMRVPNPLQITVTKSGQTYYEEASYDDGSGMQLWWINGTQVTQRRGEQSSSVSTRSGGDGQYLEFGASDFPDVRWVDASNYTGIEKVNDVKCFTFRKKVPQMSEGMQHMLATGATQPNVAEASAWIDVVTRLPVQYVIKGRKQTYQFSATPPAPPAIPDDVTQKVASWEAEKARLRRPAPTP